MASGNTLYATAHFSMVPLCRALEAGISGLCEGAPSGENTWALGLLVLVHTVPTYFILQILKVIGL